MKELTDYQIVLHHSIMYFDSIEAWGMAEHLRKILRGLR